MAIVDEEYLIEIEKDMKTNNGSWVSNEKVIRLIAEIRKLKDNNTSSKND